jgi:hypothetical protein
MVRSKIISKILRIVSLILAIGYGTAGVYSLICWLTGWALQEYGEGKFIHVLFPFSEKPFLNLDNNAGYVLCSFLIPILSYALFFWLAARVFKVFSGEKLFTHINLSRLKFFYIFNMFVPTAATIICSIFVPIESFIGVLIVLHFIIGIFTYFLAVIFSQGLHLQKEQELFI